MSSILNKFKSNRSKRNRPTEEPGRELDQIALDEQLFQASTQNHEKKKFVPCHKFEQFLTQSRIKANLAASKDIPEDQHQSLQDFVLGEPGARRTYLILANADLLKYIIEFRDNGFTDDVLPIRFDQIDGLTVGVSIDQSKNEKFEFFGKWRENDRLLFGDNYQWRFLAPVFGEKTFRYTFPRDQILPFLEMNRMASGDGPDTDRMPYSAGFFGEVFPAKIHKAHLAEKYWPKTTTGDGVDIAIKKAKDAVELLKYFDKEANNLQEIQAYTSDHLIKPIAAYRYGDERCLLFPWADGGNLDKLWNNLDNNRVNIKQFFEQFCGLSEALKELHAHTDTEAKNCIHGDLKPENILVFNQEGNEVTLQIADLGLAAFHVEANTNMRIASMIGPGTSRYQPPEMDQHGGQKSRGRAYDIWSMGCILLELLVWFTSGYEDLKIFQRGTDYFWARPTSGGGSGVHPQVHSYMTFAANNLKSGTALREILEVIRTKLLVPADERSIAPKLHTDLQGILEKCHEASYTESTTFTLKATESQPNQTDSPRSLSTRFLEVPGGNPNVVSPTGSQTSSTIDQENSNVVLQVPPVPVARYQGSGGTLNRELIQSKSLYDAWQSVPDDDFARYFFSTIEWNRVKPEDHQENPSLCATCCPARSLLNSLPRYCVLSDLQSDLRPPSKKCDLCRLLLKRLQEPEAEVPEKFTLRIIGTQVCVDSGAGLLSFYSKPGSNMLPEASLGLPQLLEPASPEHFALLQQWLSVCDSTHVVCRKTNQKGSFDMPTRLLDVGEPLHLIDSANMTKDRYVALSHCWGVSSERFCTDKSNVTQRKMSIDLHEMPQTFQDAVRVTRGLRVKYIWIDSLCIVQDDIDDWYKEAAKMEQVFSEAYCTLCASSSKSSSEGFLTRDRARPCVGLSIPGHDKLFICPSIDDFHGDVELGPLNSRGWVLQERALSRRCIHYTSTQVYWECGAGVHCETLTRLRNVKAGFLGDANFPTFALQYYRDGRILLVQDLFERYSSLDFTKPTDRYVALLGLQTRLAQAFKTQGAYGVFAAYFMRGLLWGCAGGPRQYMEPIVWPPGRRVPSWSWVSKSGAIKYMEIEFEKIEWIPSNVKHPLADGEQMEDEQELVAKAKPLRLTEADRTLITFDVRGRYELDLLRCVVLGRAKMDVATDYRKHYTLIVYPTGDEDSSVYERVGVATLQACLIGNEEIEVTIR